MLRGTHNRTMTYNYTALLEFDNSRLIKNVMKILNKADDINDVKLLDVNDTFNGVYIIKVGFTSSLNRIRTVERIVTYVKCFVNKLYNIHKDGKEYEWE